jgi:RNA polymerase sigma-70 factor (ECF subfamily)
MKRPHPKTPRAGAEGSGREGGGGEILRLVDHARSGDQRAFREIVVRYRRAVYGLARGMMGTHEDADDATQETFVRVFQALDRYDPRYSFYTWVRSITVRLCINELEKRRRRRTGTIEDEGFLERVPAGNPDPLENLSAKEAAGRVERAVSGLPVEQRSVFVLRVKEEMSYQEIAEALDISIGTVMSRLHRARRRVMERLAPDRFDEEGTA